MRNAVNPVFMGQIEVKRHEEKKSDFYENILKEGMGLA